MIRVNKSLAIIDVPISLRPPFKAHFAPKNVGRTAWTTSKRRNELIRAGSYTDADIYNSRYKLKDVKSALVEIYKNKCAFCEQKVEQFHVEHFRPKQLYPWLAFSWDNLISACQYCNEYKSTNFRIRGAKVTFVSNLSNIKNIYQLSRAYDLTELPDFVNPETTDPSGMLRFAKDGDLFSVDPRFQYTIITCKLSRSYLKDRRLKLLNDLREDLRAAYVDNKSKGDQAVALKTIIAKFKKDAEDLENEFLAFRKYIINHWLHSELKSLTK
jgi:uncharacterized protein (TIGR02646 family)